MCKGFLSCGGVAHQYLSQCDSILGMMCGDIILHSVQWLFSSGGGVLFLSCGSVLRAPPELQYFLLLGRDGGLCRGLCSSFDTRCSSQSLAWFLLSTCEGLLSIYFRGLPSICSRGEMCDSLCVMSWWAPLYLWRGDSLQFWWQDPLSLWLVA